MNEPFTPVTPAPQPDSNVLNFANTIQAPVYEPTPTALAQAVDSSLATPESTLLSETLDYQRLSPQRQKEVETIAGQIQVADSNTALTYGNKLQAGLSTFSATALDGVRVHDIGPMGDKVAELVTNIRDFNGFANKKPGFLSSFKRHFAKVRAEYSSVAKVVDTICKELQQHQVTLMQDVKNLDKLYAMNLEYFKTLSTYIIAGELKLKQERETTLAQLRETAQRTGLPEDDQKASDFAALCDQFEKKLHDLKLSRTISQQMAPQLRMVQSNDVLMAQKIQSTIVNTIPLWQQQMVICLAVENTRRAAAAEKAITDLTNEMLIHNAEQLHLGSVEVAKASERGIVDIETLTAVNEKIIATLDEVGQIHTEGAQKRRDAEAEFGRLETELGQKLLEAANRSSQG